MGIFLAIIGAGLLVSLLYFPTSQPETLVTTASVGDLGPGQTRSVTLSEHASSSASLSLDWSGSALSRVSFWATAPCGGGTSGACAVSPPLRTWSGNVSGQWSSSGPVGGTYILTVTNPGNVSLSLSAATTENYQTGSSLLTVSVAFIITGGAVLVGFGAIAVFLGLFLPGGVYRSFPSRGRLPPVDDRDLLDETNDFDDLPEPDDEP